MEFSKVPFKHSQFTQTRFASHPTRISGSFPVGERSFPVPYSKSCFFGFIVCEKQYMVGESHGSWLGKVLQEI